MKTLLWAATAAICMGTATSAVAGDLVMGGRIVRIANTGNNLDVFSIEVSGGSLNLCGSGWITFPVSASPNSADIHKRAYAAALTALTTGMTVRVYNYHNNSCDSASYIELAAP